MNSPWPLSVIICNGNSSKCLKIDSNASAVHWAFLRFIGAAQTLLVKQSMIIRM